MGGAVTLSLLLKDEKKVFDGAVLISPMLGLSSDIRPGVVKRKLLAAAAYLMPKAKLTPVKDISDVCFIDEELSVYTKWFS